MLKEYLIEGEGKHDASVNEETSPIIGFEKGWLNFLNDDQQSACSFLWHIKASERLSFGISTYFFLLESVDDA